MVPLHIIAFLQGMMLLRRAVRLLPRVHGAAWRRRAARVRVLAAPLVVAAAAAAASCFNFSAQARRYFVENPALLVKFWASSLTQSLFSSGFGTSWLASALSCSLHKITRKRALLELPRNPVP